MSYKEKGGGDCSAKCEMLSLQKKNIMSICTAARESEQKNCKFYEKSSFSDRCMYFVLEEYCDCLDAQLATQQPTQSDYIWI